jgi:beta-galactosidase
MAIHRSMIGWALTAAAIIAGTTGAPSQAAPGVQFFDADWRFVRGDVKSAQRLEFDDAQWRRLAVPHDWSIEGPYDRDAPTGRGGGYLPAGVGWYRKSFPLPAEDAGRRVFVDFDGVMAHSDVWINGQHLGRRPFGYASFRYDLTPHVKFGDGATNVIAVRVDNSRQPASRWYAGAGIYRHVRLVTSDATHIDHQATFVTTPRVTPLEATLRIATAVKWVAPNVDVKVSLQNPAGDEISRVVDAIESNARGGSPETRSAVEEFTVSQPELWSPDAPRLYTVVVEVRRDGKLVDSQRIPVGIRKIGFEAVTGFWLNGENMKLKGVCLHHDGGAVGAAVPKAVWRRRLERLKSLGVNAIRTAHNPPAPEFLDLCDELGFLVMHEVFDCWTVGKNNAQQGYQHDFREWWERDLRDAVLRDRNHPSIIIYSAGNEIRDNLRRPSGFEQFKKMKAIYDELDGSRPVTMAVFRPNQSGVYDSGFSELMDVVGQNYRENELVRAHRDKPTRKILGTENGHDRNVWLMMRDNPFFSGQFLWTGIDYLGESDWPQISWAAAPIDRTGEIRPMGYQRQSWWSEEPMVHIVRDESASGGASGRARGSELVSHWTPRDVDTYDEASVQVYSNCDDVELVLNGESLGAKPVPANAAPCEWRFPFELGVCEAIGRQGGEIVARHKLESAGDPARLTLTADRESASTDWDDVVHVEVEVVDEHGVRCPWDDSLLTFTLDGPGEIVAVDNGDPESHESYQGPKRRAYRGRALVIVRRTMDEGGMTLVATADGLSAASVSVRPSASSHRGAR